MSIFNMVGCGGSSLNYEVVDGTSAPSSPSENTIWIDTSTTITSHIFSAAEPENPDAGMVWISVGTSSAVAFSVTEENPIIVYPLSAKQYVGGAWVKKTAKSYQGKAWADWIPVGALYYFGDQCAKTSGGWSARGWRLNSTYSGTVVPTITNNDDHMGIVVPSTGIGGGVVEVNANQDLTNVKSIAIDFEMTINEYNVRLMIINRSAITTDEAVSSVLLNGDVVVGTFSRRTITLDVSGLSGSYDVAIQFADSWGGSKATGVDMKVYSVIME